MKNVTGQRILLRHVLKKFFEVPDILSSSLEYMKLLESDEDCISNMIQCAKWKMIKEIHFATVLFRVTILVLMACVL